MKINNTEPQVEPATAAASTELAALLRDLRNHDNAVVAEQLEDIATNLRSEDKCELSTCDPHALIDTREVEERASGYYLNRPPFFLPVIETFRNFLVLVPIMATWNGLSAAACSYPHAVAGLQPGETLSFLLFWQSGLSQVSGDCTPGLSIFRFDKLSQLAAFDFWLLLSVVVITIIVHTYKDILQSRADAVATDLHNRTDRAVWQLGKAYARARYELTICPTLALSEAIGSFPKTAEEMLGLLQEAEQRSDRAARDSKAQLVDLRLLAEAWRDGAGQILGQVEQIRVVYTQLQNAVGHLSTQLSNTGSVQTRVLASLVTVEAASSSQLETTKASTAILQRAMADVQTQASRSAEASGELARALATLPHLAEVLSQGEASLREGLPRGTQSRSRRDRRPNVSAPTIRPRPRGCLRRVEERHRQLLARYAGGLRTIEADPNRASNRRQPLRYSWRHEQKRGRTHRQSFRSGREGGFSSAHDSRRERPAACCCSC